VLFKSDTHQLLPIAENKLEQVAAALVDTPDERQIVVEGHTDSRGSNAYNENLSRKRAEAVRTFLISKGISANRIVAVGKGESQPVANNRTADGRANNRRVEIVVAPPR
jgi:outer membrane protein OmpA-like peptidoglycan-associated protein